jgi:heat shock protein HtpX
MFGGNLKSLVIVLILYAVSLSIALSPLGEILLRFMENCRKPATEKEINYLSPIFEEVYQKAIEENPKLNKNIKLYIMDAMYVNAFAIGSKTIAVTQGAVETFSRDELKGIIAHEFGHINYGHTRALLLTYVGNMIFSALVFILHLILILLQTISLIFTTRNIMNIIFYLLTSLFKALFLVSLFLFVNVGDIILAFNSRAKEKEADTFAHTVGFGKQLIQSLYILQKISMNKKAKLSERLKATHPHTAYRIQHLESLETKEEE